MPPYCQPDATIGNKLAHAHLCLIASCLYGTPPLVTFVQHSLPAHTPSAPAAPKPSSAASTCLDPCRTCAPAPAGHPEPEPHRHHSQWLPAGGWHGPGALHHHHAMRQRPRAAGPARPVWLQLQRRHQRHHHQCSVSHQPLHQPSSHHVPIPFTSPKPAAPHTAQPSTTIPSTHHHQPPSPPPTFKAPSHTPTCHTTCHKLASTVRHQKQRQHQCQHWASAAVLLCRLISRAGARCWPAHLGCI
jgi:hypothetical protein